MEYLFVPLCIVTMTVQNVFYKQYNLKHYCGTFKYTLFSVFFALLFFVLTTEKISVEPQVLPYSLAFAAAYVSTTVCQLIAIKIGSLAITSLVSSYSLIIPTLYGLIFLKEPLGTFKLVGLIILAVSLFLVRTQSEKSETTKKISLNWLIFVGIAFIGNGLCSTIQNIQQRRFDGAQNGNFMVYALAIAFVSLAVIVTVFERKDFGKFIKKGSFLAAATGICNGATNLLVMICIATIASSIFFPLLSGSGLVITFLISAFIYKEKFIPRQLVGLGLGLVSIILLNL